MDAFTMEIAGLAARVQPLFASTKEYCRPYLTQRVPEVYITVSEDDLMYEQAMAEKEALEEGLRVRKFSEPFLERAAIQRKIAPELLNRNTLLMHGSTVGVDGKAYLFTAPCGTGKSTHTRYWREVFGSRAVMVNDDKPFLRITEDGVYAYGSPWSGKHGLATNICLPLRGICFLKRGEVDRIRPAEAKAYLGELQHQSFLPEEPVGREIALSLVDKLSRMIPLWEMECTKNPAAALVSYEAMSGWKKNDLKIT